MALQGAVKGAKLGSLRASHARFVKKREAKPIEAEAKPIKKIAAVARPRKPLAHPAAEKQSR